MADATQVDMQIPVHDSIVPVLFNSVKFAIPNLGDNTESSNLALVRIFEKAGEYIQAMSFRRDCFTFGPPSISFVKLIHNAWTRLNTMIDASTKLNNQERLEALHVTNERRKFKVYPTRFYDVKNDYCRRYIELGLISLSNMAQLSENTWENDWSVATSREIKKLFREMYRLMCIELFSISITDAARVFDDEKPFFLTQEHFDKYNPQIPEIEWVREPALGSFMTEDQLRPITTPNVPIAPGVAENQPSEQVAKENQVQNGQIVT